MLASARGRDLAAAMPNDRLLTETDAPFARRGDRPLFPWEATDCLAELARCKGVDAGELQARVRENLKALARQRDAGAPAHRPRNRPALDADIR